ncbi:MAG: hypothetical protein E7231_05025 [Cellulosilyticum sp.]|nr:hypothetical protein [Cellulosilyticum sp.]
MKKILCSVAVIGITLAFYGCQLAEAEPIREVSYFEVSNEGMFAKEVVEEPYVVEDVLYDETNGLCLDVYMPSEVSKSQTLRPAVMLMHGGGLVRGDKKTDELTKSVSINLSKLGYVVFNVNYRLSEKGNYSALQKACSDITTAREWIAEHAMAYGVDNQFVAVGGYSSGALLAIDVAYSNKSEYAVFNTYTPFGVIDIAGGNLSFGKVSSQDAPCLMLHGSEDTSVKFADSEKLKKKLDQKGVKNTLYKMEGLGHVFTTRYEELINQIANFLYVNLTGEEKEVSITSIINPEWLNVEARKQNGIDYKASQIELKLDGKLDEWGDSQEIKINQIKDVGDGLLSEEDFSGTAYIGWNEKEPNAIYIAASIRDDVIKNKIPSDGKWYNADCLEMAFDFSREGTAEQFVKWVVGAKEGELSVAANKENTQLAIESNDGVINYEMIIYVDQVDPSIFINKNPIIVDSTLELGLSICYNDNDNNTREHQVGWTSGASNDRTMIGNVTFVE